RQLHHGAPPPFQSVRAACLSAAVSSRSEMISPAFDSHDLFPLAFIQARMTTPRTSQMATTIGDQPFSPVGKGLNAAFTDQIRIRLGPTGKMKCSSQLNSLRACVQ